MATKAQNLALAAIDLTTDSTSFVLNEEGTNKDFRIESDTNSHTFFVDASTDRVALRNSSPQATLHVNGSMRQDNVSYANYYNEYINPRSVGDGTYSGYLLLVPAHPAPGSTSTTTSIKSCFGTFQATRASTSGGNSWGITEVNISTGYTNDTGFIRYRGGNGAYMKYLSKVLFDGIEYWALAFNSSGGGPSHGIYFTGEVKGQDNNFLAIKYNTEVTVVTEVWAPTAITVGTTGAVVINDEGFDLDFRVESANNSNIIRVDASADAVGIGTATPTAPLTVAGTGADFGVRNAGDTTSRYLAIEGVADSNGEGSGRIMFTEHNTTDTANYAYGLSLSYSGEANTTWPSGFAPAAGNAVWELRGHDGSVNGAKIISGSRASQGITVHGGMVVNQDSLDNDFRVESDSNSHALFVDAGNGNVNFFNSDAIAGNENTDLGVTIYESGAINTCRDGGPNIYVSKKGNVSQTAIRFAVNGSFIGSIDVSSSGTSYLTTSDRRLKENIEAITDGTDKLMAMRPVTHTWIADKDAPAVHGFIAQEMQGIVPEAVSGDPEGEEMMSMDYGRITPVLVAALQDAHRKIAELESRLSAMEAK